MDRIRANVGTPKGVGLTIALVLCSILLPPLAVFLAEGIHAQFWINLVLTLIGWLPGVIHALFVTFIRKPEHALWQADDSGV